ncbi:MAG: cysteine-rich KTR domain-containing protein [Evtepia gabavorous]|uniref:cysteine-rich KTR domain-containing protein n=1 Tax=Evtepia gabavorous TaxID=2211183 RepID=UPI002FDDA7D2
MRNGWLVCPVCRRNKRLLHVLPETTAENLEVFCRDCKSTLKVDISIGQSVERRSQ